MSGDGFAGNGAAPGLRMLFSTGVGALRMVKLIGLNPILPNSVEAEVCARALWAAGF